MTAVLFIADLIFGDVLCRKLGIRQSAVRALKILNIVSEKEEKLIVDASAFLFADEGELTHKVLAHSDLDLTFFFHFIPHSIPSLPARINAAVLGKTDLIPGEIFAGDVSLDGAANAEDFEDIKADISRDMPEFDSAELLAMERETTEMYLSGHPLSEYEQSARSMNSTRLSWMI